MSGRRRSDGGPPARRCRSDSGPPSRRCRADVGPTSLQRRSAGAPTSGQRRAAMRHFPSRPPYVLTIFRERHFYRPSGVGSGVAPGTRALPCWIVLESLHKLKTCFAGRIFRERNGGPCGKSFWSAYAPGVTSRRTPQWMLFRVWMPNSYHMHSSPNY